MLGVEGAVAAFESRLGLVATWWLTGSVLSGISAIRLRLMMVWVVWARLPVGIVEWSWPIFSAPDRV